MSAFDKSLLVERPFEKETISALEGYVKSQASSGSYDWAANKALMKAYSCMGTSISTSISSDGSSDDNMVAILLALSMMRLPSTDFLQLSYLIPSGFTSKPAIVALIKCADILESCKFSDFWNEIKGEDVAPIVSQIKDFEDGIRNFMLRVISSSFKNMSKATLLNNLCLSENNADAFLKSSELIVASSVGGSMIEFVEQSSSNAKSAGKRQNEVSTKASELSKLMAST